MRQISVSTDVYAAIWGARQSGEDGEDAILRRLLNVSVRSQEHTVANGSPKLAIGFRDSRFGIELPEGFEIFRTYLGREYRAKAAGGRWVLTDTGHAYPSLNKLSRAIGTKVENAWNNWYYLDSNGKRQLVTMLRK